MIELSLIFAFLCMLAAVLFVLAYVKTDTELKDAEKNDYRHPVTKRFMKREDYIRMFGNKD